MSESVRTGKRIMLIGEYNHTVDAKGRVTIPAKFRSELGDRFVVTRGLEDCLSAYSFERWQRIETLSLFLFFEELWIFQNLLT